MNIYDMEIGENRLPFLVAHKMENVPDRIYSSPQTIAELFTSVFRIDKKAEEYVYMIAFNSAQEIIGVFLIGKGTVNMCVCSPREIFIRALAVGAVGIVTVHNHPSGHINPSKNDSTMCDRIRQAGQLIGIELLDFIIIGKNQFFSAREKEFQF